MRNNDRRQRAGSSYLGDMHVCRAAARLPLSHSCLPALLCNCLGASLFCFTTFLQGLFFSIAPGPFRQEEEGQGEQGSTDLSTADCAAPATERFHMLMPLAAGAFTLSERFSSMELVADILRLLRPGPRSACFCCTRALPLLACVATPASRQRYWRVASTHRATTAAPLLPALRTLPPLHWKAAGITATGPTPHTTTRPPFGYLNIPGCWAQTCREGLLSPLTISATAHAALRHLMAFIPRGAAGLAGALGFAVVRALPPALRGLLADKPGICGGRAKCFIAMNAHARVARASRTGLPLPTPRTRASLYLPIAIWRWTPAMTFCPSCLTISCALAVPVAPTPPPLPPPTTAADTTRCHQLSGADPHQIMTLQNMARWIWAMLRALLPVPASQAPVSLSLCNAARFGFGAILTLYAPLTLHFRSAFAVRFAATPRACPAGLFRYSSLRADTCMAAARWDVSTRRARACSPSHTAAACAFPRGTASRHSEQDTSHY